MIWRNSFWNLAGTALPLLIAIISMGYIAKLLGVEKFGVFLLIFAVLGYASIFDLGLTRAVIRLIAINGEDTDSNRKIIGTATWVALIISSAGSILFLLKSGDIVGFINVSSANFREVEQAFEWVSIIIPVTIISMIWFSYLEGKQSFLVLNIYKSISGVIIALLPFMAVLIEPSIISAVIGLLVARVLTLFIAFISCYKAMGFRLFVFDIIFLKKLLGFGGWVTVSNIVGPLMAYSDRFILSSMYGAEKIAYYAAPAEIITRMLIIPGSLARTLFPFFSEKDFNYTSNRNNIYIGLISILFVIVVPMFFLVEWILTIWLGSEYGQNSSLILQILLIGFVFNSLAQIPYARVQALGKPKITAIIHLAELVPYFLGLYYLSSLYGLEGAAGAWAVRAIIDYLILEYYSNIN